MDQYLKTTYEIGGKECIATDFSKFPQYDMADISPEMLLSVRFYSKIKQGMAPSLVGRESPSKHHPSEMQNIYQSDSLGLELFPFLK